MDTGIAYVSQNNCDTTTPNTGKTKEWIMEIIYLKINQDEEMKYYSKSSTVRNDWTYFSLLCSYPQLTKN